MKLNSEETIIAFTGTRKGPTIHQREALCRLLSRHNFKEAHHGDCVGSDEEFHTYFRHFQPEGTKVITHPPTDSSLRANCCGDVILPKRPYLVRNKDIVDACDVLIAVPDGPERMRSGTWSTVRYAKKTGKSVIVYMPDGEVVYVRFDKDVTMSALIHQEEKYKEEKELFEKVVQTIVESFPEMAFEPVFPDEINWLSGKHARIRVGYYDEMEKAIQKHHVDLILRSMLWMGEEGIKYHLIDVIKKHFRDKGVALYERYYITQPLDKNKGESNG